MVLWNYAQNIYLQQKVFATGIQLFKWFQLRVSPCVTESLLKEYRTLYRKALNAELKVPPKLFLRQIIKMIRCRSAYQIQVASAYQYSLHAVSPEMFDRVILLR